MNEQTRQKIIELLDTIEDVQKIEMNPDYYLIFKVRGGTKEEIGKLQVELDKLPFNYLIVNSETVEIEGALEKKNA